MGKRWQKLGGIVWRHKAISSHNRPENQGDTRTEESHNEAFGRGTA
jgi:hypothetical protein